MESPRFRAEIHFDGRKSPEMRRCQHINILSSLKNCQILLNIEIYLLIATVAN